MQGSQEPARHADHQPLPSCALPPHQQTTLVWRVPPPHRQPAPGPRWRPDPTPGAPGCYAPSINLDPHHEVSLQHYPVPQSASRQVARPLSTSRAHASPTRPPAASDGSGQGTLHVGPRASSLQVAWYRLQMREEDRDVRR
jgi:hypothetical protein